MGAKSILSAQKIMIKGKKAANIITKKKERKKMQAHLLFLDTSLRKAYSQFVQAWYSITLSLDL